VIITNNGNISINGWLLAKNIYSLQRKKGDVCWLFLKT